MSRFGWKSGDHKWLQARSCKAMRDLLLRVAVVVWLGWALTGCGASDSIGAMATPALVVAPAPTPAAALTTSPLAIPAPALPPADIGGATDGAASVLPTPSSEIPIYGYRVVEAYPHDRDAFTQGLAYADGVLYEGTGRRGQSTLRRVDLESGAPLQVVHLDDQYFGEGITVFGDQIVQLTWTSRIGFVYDRESFELLRTFTYETEGWGLTDDGVHLIMSDGSNLLFYLDAETFDVVHQVPVVAGTEPVFQLNELEYIDGLIYANIWHSDRIARIDPGSGQVTAWIDLAGLFPVEQRPDGQAVLNGIAYDAEGDRLLVTGKLWPTLFWIELIPPAGQE